MSSFIKQSSTGTAANRNRGRSAFSLLEVILALGILGTSVAILAQIMQLATESAVDAKKLTTAQLLCESKMNEAIAGLIPLQATDWTQITDVYSPLQWYYSLNTQATLQTNMVSVEVMVTNDPNSTRLAQTSARLVRLIIDPSLNLDVPPDPALAASLLPLGAATSGTAAGGTATDGTTDATSGGGF